MIHKSQKPIKYFFFKKTFLGLIALKTILNRQQCIFILCNIYTRAP